jgi:hypothetical protein
MYIWTLYVYTQVFEKRRHLCGMYKNIKKYILCIVIMKQQNLFIFYKWHVKALFCRKHVCEHRISRYTHEILFSIFLTF